MKKKLLLFSMLFALFAYIANAQDLVKQEITKETFGDVAYDTDGPSSNGFATHYDWDKIDAWTSYNGHIEAGSDSSVRINNYVTSTSTENWADASKGMAIFLCIPSAYSGS